ncbi:winged helix-turn-helix transcriptional regulator [Streptomyces sp. NPDC053427]|uniref:winged helix-turn-helix transcriptional regulator n=1 Tax=Streptomyces sp. NPDC053427 TaxID=3365701 RepID=UPI0037D7D866
MRGDVRNTQEYCAIEIAMEVLGGRWKLAVLKLLLEHGTLRFGALRRALPSITQRMLTRQLREMEADDLVIRTVYGEVPPKVEYSLTETGASLRDVAAQLDTWGRRYRETHGSAAPAGNETAEEKA